MCSGFHDGEKKGEKFPYNSYKQKFWDIMTMVSTVGFEPTTPGFIPLRLSPPVNKL